jgi:dinuclear metal center YbgI/SA1388 family protein
MIIKCKDIENYMNEFAPINLAEDWDNVGLLIGSSNSEVKRALVCLDVTSEVADEAIEQNIDIIISHHPFIFKGLKRINPDDSKGKVIYKLIKNNIHVYSSHTNLDVTGGGVNDLLAKTLGLENIGNLTNYKADKLFKVVVFVPEGYVEIVRKAMCEAGAGFIGKYSDCSFFTKGTGTYKPLEGTKPFKGSIGELEYAEEYRIESIVPEKLLSKVVDSMLKVHPYEEAAYDIYPLELKGNAYGMGKIGYLKSPQTIEDFISSVKTNLNICTVRLIGKPKESINKVAVFCGSFDENYSGVIREGADILLTGDVKYHAALDISEMGLCALDAGHFSTEKIIVPALAQALSDRFKSLTILCSSVESDPIKSY